MDFGKIPHFQEIDFTLPPDPDSNAALALERGSADLQFYIGATGWSVPEWKGIIYPSSCSARDYLKHYSRQFNTLECNTTHYRIPSVATVQSWYQQTPADFRFCPKMPQQVSHRRDLGLQSGQLRLFMDNIAGLQEKLGPVFIQFPPYFAPGNYFLLEKFLDQAPADIRIALELRHPDWFTDPALLDRLQSLLYKKGVGLVLTDVAGRRDVLHMRYSAPFSLIRFVGNGLHPTDYQRVNTWITRLAHWAEAGLREIYFFAHEPDNLLAPELAAYIYEQIKGKAWISGRGPHIQPKTDIQTKLFD
ncbi:MAG: DUF72 domain-containing protein [Saprospiraceae bacterium]|jgi:uncharacterized protein YecE (DUF72 family)|nr:DUF72 domain-containing protein [Saprospiraceae bacterium]MDP4997577.1 DUF72 domain-containing protein [Saprospiraceae bacterium]